jgi:hypothetical protein
MYRIKLKLGLLLSFLILGLTSFAQNAFLSATASKSTVGVGEQFQVTFTLNCDGQNFRSPDLSSFNVISGPNKSSSISIVNNSYTQSISFTFFLQPKTEGNFKIGPASIEVQGKRINSNIINLNVVKGSPQQGNNQNNRNQSDNQSSGITDKNLFVRAIVNKSSVFEGEALTVTFKIYTNIDVNSYTVSKAPAFNGFWNQDIEIPNPPPTSVEVIDGVRYTTAVIKKAVLFPQQSGVLTIDPMELECIARIRVRNQRMADPFGMFNDPFFSDAFGGVQQVKCNAKSIPVKVNVKELPGTAPTTFSGAVGSLTFDVSLDKTVTKENEPVNLKFKIAGNGNLKLATAPDVSFPEDLETYDPKIGENYKASDAGVNGSKTIEYLIIPRHEGDYEIPPVTFTYFDLGKQQYVSKTAGPFKIKVGKGNGSSSASSSNAKSDVQLLGRDIRYLKTDKQLFPADGGRFFGSWMFYLLSLLPIIAAAGGLYYKRQLAFNSANTTLLRSKKATSYAQKRLAGAGKLIAENKHAMAFEEISKALWGYASDKLTIPVSELSKETITEQLRSKNINDDAIGRFTNCIATCEMAQYGGLDVTSQSNKLYQDAIQIITDIEGGMKS